MYKRQVIQSLIRLKNSLIAQGRYTDGVDDVLCKVCLLYTSSALEVIEKELEEKGAELAVVQDKYDATMVKFLSLIHISETYAARNIRFCVADNRL